MRTVMIIPAVFRPSIFNKNIDYRGAREDFKEFQGSSLFLILFTKEVNFVRQNFYQQLKTYFYIMKNRDLFQIKADCCSEENEKTPSLLTLYKNEIKWNYTFTQKI